MQLKCLRGLVLMFNIVTLAFLCQTRIMCTVWQSFSLLSFVWLLTAWVNIRRLHTKLWILNDKLFLWVRKKWGGGGGGGGGLSFNIFSTLQDSLTTTKRNPQPTSFVVLVELKEVACNCNFNCLSELVKETDIFLTWSRREKELKKR